MSNENTDYFGKIFMHDVRDRTIRIWEKYLDGTMKGKTADHVSEIINEIPNELKEKFKELLPLIMNESIYNTLQMFEQNDDVILKIIQNGNEIDLTQISDGLSGELFSDDGWIKKFSEY